MAIAQPDFVAFESGQDGTWTVTLDPPEDVTGWEVSCVVRAYNGGPALITKTTASVSEIEVTSTGTGVFVVKFAAADLALAHGPGAYVIQLHRTNSGFVYPITDPAPLVIRPADSTNYPTLTNLGEYLAHQQASMTIADNAAQQVIQLLFAAEELLETLCQRKFTYAAALTEYYDGNGRDEIRLLRTPVVSVTSIYEDAGAYGGSAPGAFASTTLLTAGTNYYLPVDSPFGDGLSYSGKVRRIGNKWPVERYYPRNQLSWTYRPCPGCLKVTYVAGWRLIPYRIKLAVWNMVTQLGQMSMDGRTVTSESGEGHSVSFAGMEEQAMMIGSVQHVVNTLRNNFVG